MDFVSRSDCSLPYGAGGKWRLPRAGRRFMPDDPGNPVHAAYLECDAEPEGPALRRFFRCRIMLVFMIKLGESAAHVIEAGMGGKIAQPFIAG